MRARIGIVTGLLAVVVLAGTQAWAKEPRRQVGAHVHGAGRLAVAIEGNKLALELEAPAHDVLGFEHAPASLKEKATLEKAVARMKEAGAVFRPTSAAQCKVAKADAGLEEPPAAGAAPAQAHADFRATLEFDCAAIDKLTGIELGYFAAFPEAGKLDITVVTAKGQASRAATRSKPRLDLKGLN